MKNDINLIIEKIIKLESTLQDCLKNHSDLAGEILKKVSEISGLSFIDLSEKKIIEFLSTAPVIFEYEFCQKFECLVFEKSEQNIKIALLEPLNTARINLIKNKAKIANLTPTFFIAKSGFERAQSIAQNRFILSTLNQEIRLQTQRQNDIKENLSIIKMLDFLLKIAIKNNASDMHLESQQNAALMRLRIDGILFDFFPIESDIFSLLSSRLKLDCNLDIHELRKPQDGRFSKVIEGVDFDFRLSFMPSINGESIVLRILDKHKKAKSLEALGFSAKNLEFLQESVGIPNGLIFITGPTGSGKSTTLFSMLESIKNKVGKTKKIITIEDPVEYHMEGVTQVLVHEKSGFSFDVALRSILRQDPDIIMVGEVRDGATLETAIRASLTGHLVLSTIHANDALSVFERLLDMGAERYLLSASLRLVVAQRLLRALCSCKKELKNIALKDGDKERFNKLLATQIDAQKTPKKSIKFYSPNGCAKCNFSGFLGRILVAESIKIDTEIEAKIKAGDSKNALKNYLESSGFLSMLDCAFLELIKGNTSIEEVYRVCR